MFNFFRMLLDVTPETVIDEVGESAVGVVKDVVGAIIPIVLAILVIIGAVYGIMLGIQYAKAEDTSKRDEAKKRLINTIVGFVIAIVLVAVCWALAGNTAIWNGLIGN